MPVLVASALTATPDACTAARRFDVFADFGAIFGAAATFVAAAVFAGVTTGEPPRKRTSIQRKM
jgi:hypothetical protein